MVWAIIAGQMKVAFLLFLVVLPFWVSILVRSYAWMVLLGNRTWRPNADAPGKVACNDEWSALLRARADCL